MKTISRYLQYLSSRRSLKKYFQHFAAINPHMSENVVNTHLERTVSKPREAITAVGRIAKITQLSNTVKEISVHVPNAEFKFKAGQWVDFMIPGVETVGGFSMKSSPRTLEKHRMIELAIKRSDHPPAYWVHSKCQVGDEVSLKVGGDFFFDPLSEHSSKILMVAGGVGINPLYSIIQEIYESLQSGQLNNDVNVKLLYSASCADELLFKDELEAMAKATENITCQMFVTQETDVNDKSVQVKSGRITAEILQETLRAFNIHAMTVYICGPPPMIKFVSTTLENAGLDKGNIKLEQWW